jgi:hypothetical protein
MLCDPVQAHVQKALGVLFQRIKQVGHQVCHSRPSSVEVMNEWNRRSIGSVCFHSVGKEIFTLMFISSVSAHLEKH